MNVLILTPDAVGSTLLQRLITIYMQFYKFDRPVINLHELTNGLEVYFSSDFNCPIVSKRRVQNWGYYQSLEDIVKLLASTDHYKTSRLAQYHIRRRQDPMHQQIPFYRYLDENFFVIACRRRNVFEHALSMSINTITKRLNFHTHQEKIGAFINLYADPVDIDQAVLLSQLDAYKQYLDWSQNHFNIGSYFDYDICVNDIENYILNLPIFKNRGPRVTWQDKFGISLDDWNRCHWIPSDIGILNQDDIKHIQAYQSNEKPLSVYQRLAPAHWPEANTVEALEALPEPIRNQFQMILEKNTSIKELPINQMTQQMVSFMHYHQEAYNHAQQAMERMQQLDILLSPPPIKKQTLQDKIRMINNYQQCLDTYNRWAQDHSAVASIMSDEQINDQIHQEDVFWRNLTIPSDAGSYLPTIPKLQYQNDDDRAPNPVSQ